MAVEADSLYQTGHNLSYSGPIQFIHVVNETRHIRGYLVLKWKLNSEHSNTERILKWKQGS